VKYERVTAIGRVMLTLKEMPAPAASKVDIPRPNELTQYHV